MTKKEPLPPIRLKAWALKDALQEVLETCAIDRKWGSIQLVADACMALHSYPDNVLMSLQVAEEQD